MTAVRSLVDLVLPRRCVGCAVPGCGLCDECARTGAPFAALPGGPLEVRAAATYSGPVRQALLHYKERGRRDLASALGRLLAVAVTALVSDVRPGRVVLVCVPSSRRAVATRGGDHVLRLARRAATLTGVRVAPDVLRLTRAVRDSADLGVAERAANLAAAMRVTPGLGAGRTAILVDDIVTTGATILEAHRALQEAGWTVPGAAVVAATPRRVHPPLAPPRQPV